MMIEQFARRRPETAASSWPYTVSSAVRSSEGGDRCGDMIAYRSLEDGTFAVVVVDVAGRGNAWRPLAYYVATNLLGLLVLHCRLDRAACIADRDFRHEFTDTPAEFVAVFAALLDPDGRRMRYFSAGHETALVIALDRSHRQLGATGPAFGVETKPRHSATSVRFGPGDDLVVVTDGVTDARDERGVPFGSSGVVRAALRAKAAGTDAARSLIDDATQYAVFPDDRAAVVISSPKHDVFARPSATLHVDPIPSSCAASSIATLGHKGI